MFSLVLTAHITLAVVFSGLLLGTAWAIMATKHDLFEPLAWLIGVATIMAVGSGAYLSVASGEGALAMCGKAAVYLSLAAISEFVLLRSRSAIAESSSR